MFAHVMFVLQVLGCRGSAGVYLTGQQGHFGHFFQYYGVVDGMGRILAPGEGAVAVADNSRDGGGVQAPVLECLDNEPPICWWFWIWRAMWWKEI